MASLMGNIKISILTVTARDLGMINYQKKYLEAQSFKDFEWVIVDDNEIKLKIGETPFPVIHVASKDRKPYFCAGTAMNTGFIHCQGELVYFMADYILPHPDCLARHWQTHLRYSNAFISGRCWEVDITAEEFQQPNKIAHYNDYRLILFEHSYFAWSMIDDNIYASERKGVQNFWTGRNDSAPLEAILKCNGIDEEFDGAHGYHDEDLAQRMAILGLDYIIDLGSLCWQFPHKLDPIPQLRSDLEQHKKFKLGVIPDRIEKGIYRANPYKNLRKEREKCLKVLA